MTADLGNLVGGWLTGRLIHRGWPTSTARKTVVAIFAILMTSAIPAILTSNVWVSVALISVATFGYTGYNSNALAFPPDVFPKNMVASVWGLASMGSGFGGMLFSWLSGRMIDQYGYTPVAEYGRTPVKPVLDGEPGYENIPHDFKVANGRLEAIHARRFCYWALFSGALGHTYGCNEVWQMWAPGRQPLIGADRPWHEAIKLPGAGQMRHARTLIESGNYFDRLPGTSLVVPPNATGPDFVAACRAPDGRYALIYFPSGKPATIRTFVLKGPKLAAQWFDPRTGERRDGPSVEIAPWKTTEFKPPVADQDWVLVLGAK